MYREASYISIYLPLNINERFVFGGLHFIPPALRLLLVPVFGMATSMWLTGETLTWWKGLAMGLILAGLLLSSVQIKGLNSAKA